MTIWKRNWAGTDKKFSLKRLVGISRSCTSFCCPGLTKAVHLPSGLSKPLNFIDWACLSIPVAESQMRRPLVLEKLSIPSHVVTRVCPPGERYDCTLFAGRYKPAF